MTEREEKAVFDAIKNIFILLKQIAYRLDAMDKALEKTTRPGGQE